MIVHDLPTLPVQPILHELAEMPPMADSFLGLRSVLKPPYIYSTEEELTADLARLVDPALDAARKMSGACGDPAEVVAVANPIARAGHPGSLLIEFVKCRPRSAGTRPVTARRRAECLLL